MHDCFFCDIQQGHDDKKIAENEDVFSRFDDFPVSQGHAEVIVKRHGSSFFECSATEISSVIALLRETKDRIEQQYHPDGLNIGINEGAAAGQTAFHLHVHLIPRYTGDVANPVGGVRNIFPDKGDYTRHAQ